MSGIPPAPSPTGRPIDRRRRRRGALDRLLTAPIPMAALEARGRRALRAMAGPLTGLTLPLALLALACSAFVLWSSRRVALAPRHRAEALCFTLAQRPAFAPPMAVESSSALVRGRFHDRTPVSAALRETMRFSDDMVIQERLARVADYDVYRVWLRLPGRGSGHWLIVAWMEGPDLAISSFRFASDQTDPSPGELLWGEALLSRVLVPENFRAATLPAVRLRLARGEVPLNFGPKEPSD